MNYLPSIIDFRKDFLLFTIGSWRELTINAEFEYLIDNLSNEKESIIIESLYKQMTRRRKSWRDYFKDREHLTRFTVGLVHYYPELFIHQIKEIKSDRRCLTALVIQFLISQLLMNSDEPIDRVFFFKTFHSSEISHLVFYHFLQTYQDDDLRIRQIFLETIKRILTSPGKRMDQINSKPLLKVMFTLINYEINLTNRLFGLGIIERIFIKNQIDLLFDKDMVESLITLCYDQNVEFRKEALWSVYLIYRYLIENYVEDNYDLTIPERIVGAFIDRYRTTKDRDEKNILAAQLNQLKEAYVRLDNLVHPTSPFI